MNSKRKSRKIHALVLMPVAFLVLTACGDKGGSVDPNVAEERIEDVTNNVADNSRDNGEDITTKKESKPEATPAPTEKSSSVVLACKSSVVSWCTEYYEDTPNINAFEQGCEIKVSKCPINEVVCHFEQFKYTLYYGKDAPENVAKDNCQQLGGEVI